MQRRRDSTAGEIAMNAEKRAEAAARKPVLARIVEHFAKWRLPDDVILVESLPMTATGKIGKRDLREKLRRLEQGIQTTAVSTVHVVLDRHGLVKRCRRRRPKAQGSRLSWPSQPNDPWSADFRGEFMLADHRDCYPPTVSDFASPQAFFGLSRLAPDTVLTMCPEYT
jgi:hypothetical protein